MFYFVVFPQIIALVILEKISLILTLKTLKTDFHYVAQAGLKLMILVCQASQMLAIEVDTDHTGIKFFS